MSTHNLESSCTRIATRILADQINSYAESRPLSTGDVARMVHLAVRAGAHAALSARNSAHEPLPIGVPK